MTGALRQLWPALAVVGAGCAVGAVVLGVVSLDGGSVRPWLVLATAVVAAAAAGAILVLGGDLVREPQRTVATRPTVATPTDRQQGGAARTERLFGRAMDDAGRYADTVAPWLRELATHRLRTRHGIDPTAPAAQALVGEELWMVLTMRRPPLPTRAALDRMLTRIEEL